LDAADETWVNVDQALRQGLRGLRPGSSLARLLAKHRGKRNRKALPRYTLAQILTWPMTFTGGQGTGHITGTARFQERAVRRG
jgi:hypothetical protein